MCERVCVERRWDQSLHPVLPAADGQSEWRRHVPKQRRLVAEQLAGDVSMHRYVCLMASICYICSYLCLQYFYILIPVSSEPERVFDRNSANFAELREYAHTGHCDRFNHLLHVQHGVLRLADLRVPSGRHVQSRRRHVLFRCLLIILMR